MHHLSTPRILLEIPTSVPCNLQCVLLLNFVHVSKTCSHDDSKSSEPRCRDAVGWLPLASENPLDPVREGFRHDTPDSFVLGESSARQCFLKEVVVSGTDLQAPVVSLREYLHLEVSGREALEDRGQKSHRGRESCIVLGWDVQ